MSYFRKYCYEVLGQALFTGLFHRSLNKVTHGGFKVKGDQDIVTHMEDLDVVVGGEVQELEVSMGISGTVRSRLLNGRRTFRQRSGWQQESMLVREVDNFLTTCDNVQDSSQPLGGNFGSTVSSGHGGSEVGRMRSIPHSVIREGASHFPRSLES